MLGALGTLRTLEFNTQLPFEPCNCPGNAVDERLDELGVGNAAADGLDGIDEVLFVVFVDGANKAEPRVPGKSSIRSWSCRRLPQRRLHRACRFYGGTKARNARSNYQYISRFHRFLFLVRRIVARVIGKGVAKIG